MGSGTYNFVIMQRYNYRPVERVYNKGPYFMIQQMAMFMKTSLKNRLCILSLFLVIIPRGSVTSKKGIWDGARPGLELKRRDFSRCFFAHFFSV